MVVLSLDIVGLNYVDWKIKRVLSNFLSAPLTTHNMASKTLNFYDLLKLNFVLSSVFGFSQYSINFADISEFKVKLVDIIALISWSIYYCFEIYYNHTFTYSTENFNSTIYLISIILSDRLTVIGKLILMWLGFLKRRSIQKFLKEIFASWSNGSKYFILISNN